jgi:hypothetical protein
MTTSVKHKIVYGFVYFDMTVVLSTAAIYFSGSLAMGYIAFFFLFLFVARPVSKWFADTLVGDPSEGYKPYGIDK